ncbi:MAG: NAD(P)-dependent oxidoreductase [Duncaniella sp.]|nr:NAD(P)-dependent oxidoreductase [Duncaniella sp.]
MTPPKKVLIVGAGGFIGGFIAAESLRRGFETWCGVRESTSRRYLTDPALHFLILDYDDPARLKEQLSATRFDYIVYNLGATKCVNFLDFNRINYVYLRNFVEALQDTGTIPDRMVYMSSLSAIGPGDEKNYTPLTDSSVPAPNTRYGLSKIKAETFLQSLPASFPWIILRPTGVYGPHEQDYLMMIKSIDSHLDFGVGMRRQMLTFIYVEDLARAIFDALERAPLRHKYIVSEPRAYTQAQFRRIVSDTLGRRLVIPVRLPLWMLSIACRISEKWGAAKMQPVTLNTDKYNILAQRNWACDITPAQRDWGFAPRIDLAEGIRRTVLAYRQEKLNASKPR